MYEMIPTSNMSREEWLQLRKTGIGGSDAGAICGLNPYSSPMSVYRDKTCEDTDNTDNEAMRQGRDLEDYVARRFMEATGLKVRRSNMMYRSAEHPCMIADVDRLIVGEDAGTEREKSQASDSFKRACFNVGIGRELYTAPDFIWVPAEKVKLQKKGDKFITYDRFRVKSIEYNDQREISALVIANSQDKVVYSWIVSKSTASQQPEHGLSEPQMTMLQQELARTGVALEAVLERYHLNHPGEMSPDIYKQAMNSLRKTRSQPAA